MVIDFHTHIFPDALAGRAVASLASASGLVPVCAADKASETAYLKANGVDRMVCQNIAVSPRTMRSVNDFAISSADDFVLSFGSVHPDGDWRAELNRLAAAGIRGIKFHPEYQNFFIDEARMFPIYEACFSLGFVVLFHCGLDLAYAPPLKAPPARTARVAKAFPGAKIVAAHLGGFAEPEEVVRQLGGLGIYADLAACGLGLESGAAPEGIAKDSLNEMVRAFGTDRVLFGTDCPWQSPKSGFEVMELLDLTEAEREGILHKNAETLLGI